MTTFNTDTSADSIYLQAESFLDSNQKDSSFIYFDLAKNNYQRMGDSLNAAKCLVQMAITLYEEGDYYGAQETSLEADRLLDKRNVKHQSILSYNYNNLGNAISGYGDHNKAIAFYDSAIQYATDSLQTRVCTNNKAVTLFNAKRFKEAYSIHKENLTNKFSSNLEYARALSNYANSRWKIDNQYIPVSDLHKALNIRIKENDVSGMNSTYSHLYLYYKDISVDSAKTYANKAFTTAVKTGVPNDEVNALEKMIEVSNATDSKKYFQRYTFISDSIRDAGLKTRNQYAMIRYEVEKSKSENLMLQKEIISRDSRIFRGSMIVLVSVIILLFGLGLFLIFNKRKNRQLRIENEIKLKENQLQLSKKVHDVVANGIYRVMTEIEHKVDVDREDLLDKLEIMYEKSRDISYSSEANIKMEEDFNKEVSLLIKSFSSDNVKIFIAGNDQIVWDKVSKEIQQEINPLLQELLVNMSKHSNASEVVFRFEIMDSNLIIYYQDNGIGSVDSIKYGNGLHNTGNRMGKLNGTLTFENNEVMGLRINLIIPIF